MSTTYRYTLPVEQTEWKFDGNTETCFTWEYDEPREALLQLYAKGKKQQWDAAERIDWSQDLDREKPDAARRPGCSHFRHRFVGPDDR